MQRHHTSHKNINKNVAKKKLPTDEEYREILKNEMFKGLEESGKKRRISRNNERFTNALDATLKEFLDTYVVIGFDPEGDEVVISHANTNRDLAALHSLRIKEFTEYMQS